MELNKKDIEHLANLSALEFDEARLEEFKNEFNAIIGFVEKISNADVDNDELEYKTIDFEDLREDVIKSSISQDKVLKNAPSKKQGGFAVPLMME